jgi:peptidylprolyl isomerase
MKARSILILAAFILIGAKKPPSPAVPSPAKPAPSLSDILAASPASDWQALNPARVLIMELGDNRRVVMYLAASAAPRTVANIQTFAREKYWDGLAIVRVQDNYVVQWGDPNGEGPQAKPIGSVKPKLAPEFDMPITKTDPVFVKLASRDAYARDVGFSDGFATAHDVAGRRRWLTHCYGAVGVGRGETADSGNGQELYIVNGHSPRHLDRNVTVVGKVISGMEHLSSLPRGTGPLGFYEKAEERTPILQVRLLSDFPAAEQIAYERLDTRSATFRAILKNRRERKDGWFLHSPGAVDLCNTPLPYRVKK